MDVQLNKIATWKGLAVCVMLLLILGGCVGVDLVLLNRARPPEHVRAIEDFRNWKKALRPERDFEHGGTNYIVAFGPAGRMLASGSAAYVFDPQGNLVDWTADAGDFKTRKFGFELGGGKLLRSGGETDSSRTNALK